MGLWNGIGNGIGRKKSGISWQAYWTQRSLFFLDGTIITVGENKYFEDKSVNDRHFLITGYDFATDWTTGFPYKSAATISAPAADAALIAADINNFLYAADGTPNAINVNQIFGDIDYANTIFSKHVAQTVDGNGVEVTEAYVSHIFMSDGALTGADLIKAYTDFGVTAEAANAMWVLATGNDTTGNGTKAAPYLQLDKADGTANDAAIPIYVGTKNDYTGDATLVYLYDTLAHTIKGIGRAIVRTAAAVYTHRLRYDNKASLHGLSYIPSGNLTAHAVYQQACPSIELERLLINATATGAVGPQFKHLKNSVIQGTFSTAVINLNTVFTGNILIDSNYISGTSVCVLQPAAIVGTITLSNNRIRGTYSGVMIYNTNGVAMKMVIIGNHIDVTPSNIIFNQPYNAPAAEISYNTFIMREHNQMVAAFSVSLNANEVVGNKIYDVDNYAAGEVYIVRFSNSKGAANNNLFDIHNTQKTAGGAEIDFQKTTAAATIDTCVASGNKILSNRTAGYHIKLGEEATSVANDTITLPIIEKNYIKSGAEFDDSYAAKTTHCTFIAHQNNGHIRYNFVFGGGYGLIVKGTDQTFTSGGIYYNLVKNMIVYGALVKGCHAVNVINNTLFWDACNPTVAIGLTANTEGTDADTCVVKNNIVVYLGTGNFTAVLIEEGASNVVDYNLYYCPNGTLRFSISGDFKTLAEWQALGYDTHSTVLTAGQYAGLFTDAANDDFSLPAGSVAIGAGEAQAEAYDDGLDASTDWGTDTEVPTVVTKQQGAAWDCGAYIH